MMGSSNENGGVPPGFRFHPTDEELLHYYLKKKVSFQKFDMEVIREVDLNKIEPWDLQERCKIGASPQNEWYFFSHKDRKYPTGSRTNRATNAGFWKATGRDKCIRNSLKKIGMRKTLVFYRGRAPHGQKTDWIMHEYRLEDPDDPQQQHNPNDNSEDGWVVCRVFKKKNLIKVGVGSGDQASAASSNHDHHLILNGDNHENRYTMMHRDMHSHHHHQEYLLHHQHEDDHMTTHDYMNHIPSNHYSQFQPHNFLPLPSFHKEPLPLMATYNNDFPTLTSKPLIPCEGRARNDQNLCYQSCDTGLDVQACEHASRTNVDSDTNGPGDPNLSKWAMVDPHLLNSSQPAFGNDEDASAHDEVNASSMTHINPLAIGGEIELWGYRK